MLGHIKHDTACLRGGHDNTPQARQPVVSLNYPLLLYTEYPALDKGVNNTNEMVNLWSNMQIRIYFLFNN